MRKKTLGEMPSAEQLEAELKREKYKRRYHSVLRSKGLIHGQRQGRKGQHQRQQDGQSLFTLHIHYTSTMC